METFVKFKAQAIEQLRKDQRAAEAEKKRKEAEEQKRHEQELEEALELLAQFLPGWAIKKAKITITRPQHVMFDLNLDECAPIRGWCDVDLRDKPRYCVPGIYTGFVSGYGLLTETLDPHWEWGNKYTEETDEFWRAVALAADAYQDMEAVKRDYQVNLEKAINYEPSPVLEYKPVEDYYEYETVKDSGQALVGKIEVQVGELEDRIRKIVREELGR